MVLVQTAPEAEADCKVKRIWNATAGPAIVAAAVLILASCGSADPGSGSGGEQTTQTTSAEQTAPASKKGLSRDRKDGATEFQNAVAKAVEKRYSGIETTGNGDMPTEVGQHTTVSYSSSVQGFTCDTVYLGGENVKLTKCLNAAGDPLPDPAPDPAYS